jgi:hypothetical protein
MDYKVFTNGIDYSNKFRKTVTQSIEKLMEEAPANSFGCICLNKIGDTFSGTLRIRTHVAHFGAVDVADSINHLMAKLANEVSSQLTAWREVRFEDDYRHPYPSFADDRLISLVCNEQKCPLNRSHSEQHVHQQEKFVDQP